PIPLPLSQCRVWLKHENGRAVLAFESEDPGNELWNSPEFDSPNMPELRIVLVSHRSDWKNETIVPENMKRRDFLINLDDPCLDTLTAQAGGEPRKWPATDRVVFQVKKTTVTDVLESRLATMANHDIPVATLADPALFESRPELLDGFMAFTPAVLGVTSGDLHKNPHRLSELLLRAIRDVRAANPSGQIEVRIPPPHLGLSDSAFESRIKLMAKLLTGLFELPGDLPGLGPMVSFLDAILHGCVTSEWEESAPVFLRDGEC